MLCKCAKLDFVGCFLGSSVAFVFYWLNFNTSVYFEISNQVICSSSLVSFKAFSCVCLCVNVKLYLAHDFVLSSSALLDVLTKNGSSAGNGAYRRRPAESSESSGAQPQRESQESGGGGDSSKTFTKDQVDGVQRWEFQASLNHPSHAVLPQSAILELSYSWPLDSGSSVTPD